MTKLPQSIFAVTLLGAARVTDALYGVSATIDTANRIASAARILGAVRHQQPEPAARRVSDTISRVSSLIPTTRCVHRAAAGRVWLACIGVESEIVVGLRRDERWQGHAWLEVIDGTERIVLFGEEVTFRPVWRRS